MKEVGGKYSLSVISADNYDPVSDEVELLGGARQSPESLAASMIGPRGYIVQRRLRPDPGLAAAFVKSFGRFLAFESLRSTNPRSTSNGYGDFGIWVSCVVRLLRFPAWRIRLFEPFWQTSRM
jgi:hypothetical protein